MWEQRVRDGMEKVGLPLVSLPLVSRATVTKRCFQFGDQIQMGGSATVPVLELCFLY